MFPELDEIGKVRKKLGLTQSDLARIANVSQSTIAKIENGLMEPSYTITKKIFLALEKERAKKEKNKVANEISTKKIISVTPEDSVKKAVKLMNAYAISQLPVIEEGRVVGGISESNLISKFETLSRRDLKVEEVMGDPFPLIPEDTPVKILKALLEKFPAVLTVRKGEITGIVTKSDLLNLIR